HIAMGRMPYEYYRTLQSPSAAGPDVIYPHHGPQITFLDFVEKPNYTQLGSEIPRHQRVWFVISGGTMPSRPDKTAAALSALISTVAPTATRHDFGGIQVVLSSRSPVSGSETK